MGMASYINREDVIEEINDAISNIAFTSPYQNDIGTMVCGMERVLDIVEDAFACDVVEVVRCKDCWLFDKTGYDEDNEHEEDLSLHSGWCKAWRRETQGCHFCSYGERREGE